MTFVPHTERDRQQMLEAIGVKTIADLFEAVPQKFRFPKLNLPAPLTEMEALGELKGIAEANESADDLVSFLGAGAYHHYIPAGVDSILRRGEYYTAYTPYQPEISQGTLQAIFEYQSLIVALTGMEVSNASHYDGATALAEAVNMSHAIHRGARNKIILSPGIHPQYRAVVHTYEDGGDLQLIGEDLDLSAGPDALIELIDEHTALVCVAYPDFFGRVYDYTKLAEAAHAKGALLAVSVNPTALGLLKPPGEMGADIVTGEGQPLGIPLSFGGPYLGILTTRNQYVRQIAGRLVGETVDSRGQRGFVLTLSTREQHIKREKASSNICTNQGLMMLAATTYMSLLGKSGLRQVAESCYHKAHYAATEIAKLKGFGLKFKDAFFHEFVVECPIPAAELNLRLLELGIVGGYALGAEYPGMQNCMLLTVTELNSKEEIDYLVETLAEVAHA
ncbi:MAG TPA: aminomethyl-transferring glycine dehydrogenase subunit GcvPA [Anaerolineales bacterium]|nr:aminomethyl-transferring glycine dehydrogenase subunit GcvPA [Anaerolineales bacterium]HRQ91510.1 aminomethyl-transferring glycine dehydrogenase subunit GcvPA [Anaerolineales bacterium]